jgi:hypothetical protein
LPALLILNGCQQPGGQKQEQDNVADNQVKTIPDTADVTNNFYDNAETYSLKINPFFVEGEISNPGEISFSSLPLHSVIVKEAALSADSNKFIGAYRYDGYSLLDILNNCILNKANEKEFPPIIDLFVEVENAAGEKVIISWGEIYYPSHLHEILIASKVMRIVPSKTKELWPLPVESKLVVAADLITERNISAPVKITVRSCTRSFETIKGKSPTFSQKIDFIAGDKLLFSIENFPTDLQVQTYESIFYGRGRGIHSTQPFQGIMLKDLFKPHFNLTKRNLQQGLITIKADDGYRGVFTCSEVMNRNDQAETLLIHQPEEKDGGAFRLFPAGDFFSDRAIKAISHIYIDLPK